MDDHPFTLTSSARQPGRPSFTVKAMGDLSASLAGLRAGEEILVDGPHGDDIHDRDGVRGHLLLAAGIGIAPALSVLRTSAEHDGAPAPAGLCQPPVGGPHLPEQLEDLER